MHRYVITHKPLDWRIPFEHKLVTVDQYRQDGALHASDYIGKEFSGNRTFAIYAGIAAILKNIDHLPDDDFIVVNGYRSYFGSKLNTDISFTVPENTNNNVQQQQFRDIITPDDLQANWGTKLLNEFPKGYELVISRPLDLGSPIIEQYSTYHHLDDLLFGIGHAVRAGIIPARFTAHVLTTNFFIAQFASRVSFFRNLYERVWWLAKEVYAKSYVQREGYQERSINFMLERIISIYLTHKIYVEKLPTICTNLVHIDPNLSYAPTR